MKKFLLAFAAAACLLLGWAVAAASAADGPCLSVAASREIAYGGDETEVSVALTAENVGAMQLTLRYDAALVTYVPGSAAFAGGFGAGAMTAVINDATEGEIRAVYSNPAAGKDCANAIAVTARFVAKTDVTGTASFALENVKLLDATVALNEIQATVSGASVSVMPFNAGSAALYAETDSNCPMRGDTVTVSVRYSGDPVGAVQGELLFDPLVLEYVEGSAQFQGGFAEGAVRTAHAEAGCVRFVYADTEAVVESGCVVSMCFRAVGRIDAWCDLTLANLKATNADPQHLAMLDITSWGTSVTVIPKPDVAYYSLDVQEESYRKGSEITLALAASGTTLGGMQGTIEYDPEQLAYVAESAAFSPAFSQSAGIAMANDAVSGRISLVATCPQGFEPDGSAIFTARFRILAGEAELRPVFATGLKTVNASLENAATLASEITGGVSWRFTRLTFDMSGTRWDYTKPLVYDGTDQTVRLLDLPDGLAVLSYSGNMGRLPGTYVASATLTCDTDIYETPAAQSLTWQIECTRDHAALPYAQITPATCVLEGLEEIVCPVCGMGIASRPIPALGHDYAEEYTVDTPATCTALGSQSRHCARCDSVTDRTPIPMRAHAWGEWSVDIAPTAEDEGMKHRTCVDCQAREESSVDRLLKPSADSVFARIGDVFSVDLSGEMGGAAAWHSDNGDVATVSESGVVSIVGAFDAVIAVREPDGTPRSVDCAIRATDAPTSESPTLLARIDANAFVDVALESIDLSANVGLRIAERAFVACGKLKALYLPPEADIAVGAFAGCESLTLYCASELQTAYAREQGIPYVVQRTAENPAANP